MSNINEIDRRLLNLENQVKILLENLARNKKYTDYDIEAGRVNTSKAQRSADSASELSRENEGCILEVADIASENDGAILELAEYIANLEERIEKLEGGNS